MIKIWFLIKFVEAVLCLTCLVIHILGFLYKHEPQPHQFIFCGTFFGALLVSLIGAISILIRNEITMVSEVILTGFFFILFIASAIVSMANAEKDIHLLFLTDAEETWHDYFRFSRMQSLLALTTSLIFLLHCIYCLDLLLVTTDVKPPEQSLSVLERRDLDAIRPLKLRLNFADWFYTKFKGFRAPRDQESIESF
ncbi:uncharacterized protein LOC132265739 [Phlebotomus argentipes]|uniref:uncharacterized protein LOC132265739 n=1 Tax=Phlebotomus argentipes TaxID=94469 RepID=UPI0028934D58|nr:uncharacterized protein LOC132265739 [Phlebotomus argentipes]